MSATGRNERAGPPRARMIDPERDRPPERECILLSATGRNERECLTLSAMGDPSAKVEARSAKVPQ
jgi:hypothetical protein